MFCYSPHQQSAKKEKKKSCIVYSEIIENIYSYLRGGKGEWKIVVLRWYCEAYLLSFCLPLSPVWVELIHWIHDSGNSFLVDTGLILEIVLIPVTSLPLLASSLSLSYCFCCVPKFIRVQRNLGMFFSSILINTNQKPAQTLFRFSGLTFFL